MDINLLCDFCDALANEGDIGNTVSFLNLNKNINSRTIYSDESFSVLATIGHFKEGYLLLLTNAHYPSFAHLNTYSDLEKIYKNLKRKLESVYGEIIIFEHGPMPVDDALFSACGSGGCVDHAHLHFIPSGIDPNHLRPYLFDKFNFKKISLLEELKEQADRNMPYLFVEFSNGERYVFDTPILPSQYLRKVIYELDIKNYDDKWSFRQYPELEKLERTVNKLKNEVRL